MKEVPSIENGLTKAESERFKMLVTQINGCNPDIFKDMNLENNQHKLVYQKLSIKKDIRRSKLIKHHGNLNICISFKAIKKVDYIKCLIKRIELAK